MSGSRAQGIESTTPTGRRRTKRTFIDAGAPVIRRSSLQLGLGFPCTSSDWPSTSEDDPAQPMLPSLDGCGCAGEVQKTRSTSTLD